MHFKKLKWVLNPFQVNVPLLKRQKNSKLTIKTTEPRAERPHRRCSCVFTLVPGNGRLV